MTVRHTRYTGAMSTAPALPPPGFDELSPEEKLDYIEALWNRVAVHPEEIPVPEWHRRIVSERLAAHRRGEGEARPWSEVRNDLRDLLRNVRR